WRRQPAARPGTTGGRSSQAHRGETAPVLGAGALLQERGAVGLGGVALVGGETIAGETFVQAAQFGVASDFGDHRGGRNAKAKGIAADNRTLRQINLG